MDKRFNPTKLKNKIQINKSQDTPASVNAIN